MVANIVTAYKVQVPTIGRVTVLNRRKGCREILAPFITSTFGAPSPAWCNIEVAARSETTCANVA